MVEVWDKITSELTVSLLGLREVPETLYLDLSLLILYLTRGYSMVRS